MNNPKYQLPNAPATLACQASARLFTLVDPRAHFHQHARTLASYIWETTRILVEIRALAIQLTEYDLIVDQVKEISGSSSQSWMLLQIRFHHRTVAVAGTRGTISHFFWRRRIR